MAARAERGATRAVRGADADRPPRRAAAGPDACARWAMPAILGRSFSLRDLVTIGSGAARASGGTRWTADARRPSGPDGGARPGRRRGRRPAAAAAAPGRRRRLHVHPRAGPRVRDEPSSRSPAGARSTPRSSTCCSKAASRPRRACRCSPSTRSRPATTRAARFSIDAAAAALASNAPEEALRLVDQALPVVSSPADRRSCSRRRRRVRRPPPDGDRLDGLAELAALAEAMRDPSSSSTCSSGALGAPVSHDEDAAAELARRVAIERRAGAIATGAPGDLELGQALLRTAWASRSAVRERGRHRRRRGGLPARHRARRGARRRSGLAAALREIGMIDFARPRVVRVEVIAGRGNEASRGHRLGRDSRRSSSGTPIAPLVVEAPASSSGRSGSTSGSTIGPA